MEELKSWFNSGCLYDAGVALYLKLGKDESLKHLFTSEGGSPFKEKKLVEALSALLDDQPAETLVPEARPLISAPVEVKAQPVPEIFNRWPEQLDGVLQALKSKWQPLFSEMVNLQSRIEDVAKAGLKDIQKKDEAGRMALRILDLDDQCYDIYAARDYYLEHGRLPHTQATPVEIALDPTIWHKRLANHERYVREYRSKLKKQPDNVRFAESLKKNEWAVAEYKKLLKLT